MKICSPILLAAFLLSTVASLTAGDVIFYGGAQKPGKVSFSDANITDELRKGDFGGTLGVRFSTGKIIGFEENVSFSPRFAKPGLKAFQMDSNLIVQGPGKIVPYATAGIGFVKSWGQDFPTNDPTNIKKLAAFAFSFGTNFSVNYGGGLKLRRLWGPLGLNFDVRGYTLPDVHGDNLNFIQTSAGAVISW